MCVRGLRFANRKLCVQNEKYKEIGNKIECWLIVLAHSEATTLIFRFSVIRNPVTRRTTNHPHAARTWERTRETRTHPPHTTPILSKHIFQPTNESSNQPVLMLQQTDEVRQPLPINKICFLFLLLLLRLSHCCHCVRCEKCLNAHVAYLNHCANGSLCFKID